MLKAGTRLPGELFKALLRDIVRYVQFTGAKARVLGVLVRHEFILHFVEGDGAGIPIERIAHQTQAGARDNLRQRIGAVRDGSARF